MKGILVQIFCVLSISIGDFLIGHATAWSSYTFETLESDNSPLGTRLSKNEASLLGSLPSLGQFLSTLYTGVLADAIGRKRTVILDALCFSLSWAIISTATNVKLMLVGRFFNGLAAGMHIISMMFVSEIVQTHIRGTLTSICLLSYTSGILVSYVSGWFCTYEMVNYFPLILSVFYVMMMISFVKETPAFLMIKGNEKEAMKSLKFYRGVSKESPELLQEFASLRNQRRVSIKSLDGAKVSIKISEGEQEKLKQDVSPDKVNLELELNNMSAWQLLKSSKANQRALLITITFVLLLVNGGTIAVMAYAGKIFVQAAPTLSPHLCSVIVALSFAIGGGLSAITSDLIGRRALFMTSGVLSSICLVSLSCLFRWRWLPEWCVPALMLAYCCTFQTGVACVPFVQLAEIFVPKLKSLTTMIVMVFMSIGNFILLALYGPAVEILGLDGTFLVFAVICAIATAAAYFMMRETKGVPVEDIQKMFEHGFLYKSAPVI